MPTKTALYQNFNTMPRVHCLGAVLKVWYRISILGFVWHIMVKSQPEQPDSTLFYVMRENGDTRQNP